VRRGRLADVEKAVRAQKTFLVIAGRITPYYADAGSESAQ